jgi:hypothetical protein
MLEEIGAISKAKLLQLERQFEQQRYQIELRGLQDSRALVDPRRDPQKYQQINLQIEELERQHQARLNAIDRAALAQRNRYWDQSSQVIAQGFAKIVTMDGSLRDNLISTWKSLVGVVQQVIEEIVQHWITAFLIRIGLEKTAGQSGIMTEAAKAGAGGVASMAAAPFPINTTAPAFGASMFAAAASYSAVNAAEKGDWDVREGLYHLHENEMVLPAWAASPLRTMLTGGANDQAPFGRPGGSHSENHDGDAHYHYSPHLHGTFADWDQMIRNSDRDARRWFARQVRHGRVKRAA